MHWHFHRAPQTISTTGLLLLYKMLQFQTDGHFVKRKFKYTTNKNNNNKDEEEKRSKSNHAKV